MTSHRNIHFSYAPGNLSLQLVYMLVFPIIIYKFKFVFAFEFDTSVTFNLPAQQQ